MVRECVVSGTVDTPERPDEALTGPSKTGPVCCGTSTARRTHGRPCAGHRGGGHQTCSSVEAGHARRGRGARGGARLLTRTRARARAHTLTLTCSSASPRLDERPDPGEWRTAREQRSTCQRVRGEGCVPCQILLRLANAGQGKPGGRAAAPCRGAAAARGVSGKSVQATATVHPSGAVPAQSDAKAGGASAGGGAGRSGGWGVGASHPWVVRF